MSDIEHARPSSMGGGGVIRPTVKFLTAAGIGFTSMIMSGLTLTGTVTTLVIATPVLATPVLVLFSPVIVPAVITLFLLAAGFLSAGTFGTGAIAVFAWTIKYLRGKHPVGAEKLDRAGGKIEEKARDMKERAKEYGQYVQQQAQKANQSQGS